MLFLVDENDSLQLVDVEGVRNKCRWDRLQESIVIHICVMILYLLPSLIYCFPSEQPTIVIHICVMILYLLPSLIYCFPSEQPWFQSKLFQWNISEANTEVIITKVAIAISYLAAGAKHRLLWNCEITLRLGSSRVPLSPPLPLFFQFLLHSKVIK